MSLNVVIYDSNDLQTPLLQEEKDDSNLKLLDDRFKSHWFQIGFIVVSTLNFAYAFIFTLYIYCQDAAIGNRIYDVSLFLLILSCIVLLNELPVIAFVCDRCISTYEAASQSPDPPERVISMVKLRLALGGMIGLIISSLIAYHILGLEMAIRSGLAVLIKWCIDCYFIEEVDCYEKDKNKSTIPDDSIGIV